MIHSTIKKAYTPENPPHKNPQKSCVSHIKNMQNKPNLNISEPTPSVYGKKTYVKSATFYIKKTNPIQTQYKANSNPIQSQTNPISACLTNLFYRNRPDMITTTKLNIAGEPGMYNSKMPNPVQQTTYGE